jgi:hypothetical protein
VLRAALDRQPAQQMDFDTLRKTGLGLGVEADFLATLASDPPEAVSRKFDSICILRDIPLENGSLCLRRN